MSSSKLMGKGPSGEWCRNAIQMLGGALAILLLCLPVFSQANFGRITGTVTDQSGGVINSATVTVLDVDRGVARTLTTDDAGEYNAPTLNPGNYTVRAEAKGFKKLERQSIVLQVGQEIRIDLTLQTGAQEQTVTVTESVPLVETTNATLGGTLDNSEIVDMPLNGRNYQNLLSLRPGVMIQPGGGPWTQATNGIRPDENAWMIDGVINANFFDSRPIIGVSSPLTDAATILPIDAIQEFNTMENPKAEAGWKPGAIVNVGIKSGTNALHGAAYAFGRQDSWDARNFFNPGPASDGSCVIGPSVAGASPCDKTPAQLKQFGAAVGGPIKKDKLFFFGAYEGLRSLIGNSLVTGGVPETIASGTAPKKADCPAAVVAANANADCKLSMVDAIAALQASGIARSIVSEKAAGCTGDTPLDVSGTLIPVTCTGNFFAPNPSSSKGLIATFPISNQTDNGVGKLDYRINDKNTITGLLVIGNYTGVGMDHPFVQAIYNDTFPIKTWTTTENWIWTPSSSVVNELRFGYDRFTLGQVNDDASLCQPGTCPINTGLPVAGVPQMNLTGFNQVGTQHNRPQLIGPNPYFDVQDNVSYLKGKHSLKFGVEFAHVETDSNIPDYARGRINFKGAIPLENYFAGIVDSGIAFVGNAARVMTFTSTAGFIQDDWRITSKLILNMGLRYSYNSPFHEANNLWANFDPSSATGLTQQGGYGAATLWNPDRTNFSPRLGFAWDVTGKGTTVVRGGASIMYSTFTAVMWMSQNSFSNSSAVTLASNPTSASLVSCPAASIGLGACGVAPTTTPGSGNLAAVALSFPNANNICWDPSLVAKCAPSSPGQATVFPAGTKLTCGDGIGTDGNPCPLMGVDPNLKTPRIFNFNLGIQHQFGSNLSLEIGYVGNHGDRLTGFNEINQPPAGAGWCLNSPLTTAQLADACKPYVGQTEAFIFNTLGASAQAAQEARPLFTRFPYLSFINEMTNRSRSNYNSLQATLTKRTSHGLSFIAGYTFAHGLDNGSLNRYALLPQNAGNTGAEYGSGDFDVRHRFTLTTTYNIPGIKGFGQLLEGWQINSIVNLQSPQPWSVNDYKSNTSGSFDFADRWNFTGDPSGFKATASTIPYCTGNSDGTGGSCTTESDATFLVSAPLSNSGALWQGCVAAAADLNTLQGPRGGCYVGTNGKGFLTPPALGQFGNMPRNIFRDSGFRDWDLSLFKNFTFKERYGVQFRWEIFNVLNHPIPANPFGASNNASNANNDPSNDNTAFGGSGGTPDFVAGNPLVGSGSQRVMQLGLKLTF